MRQSVTIIVDDEYFSLLMEKMPFLDYSCLDDFVNDAVSLRLECLLHLLALPKSSHE